MSEALYQTFLEFMDGLEAFRGRYILANPGVPLERDDPDVSRLVESLAYFSARSHLAAQERIGAVHRRLFEQSFPFILSPLPAMAVVEIRPRGALVEAVSVPAGTEVVFSTDDQVQAQFRTLRSVRLLPLRYLELFSGARADGRQRIMLLLDASHLPMGTDLGEVSLYVNHLNDFGASIHLLESLRTHLERVSILSGPDIGLGEALDDDGGRSCEFSFGLPDGPGEREPSTTHPIARVRSRLHFPEQDLFFNIHVPDGVPWSQEPFISERRRICLCLDVGPGWPEALRPTARSFVFFASPVINLIHEQAEPIRNDGTRIRHRIRHPASPSPRSFHSARGVFRVTSAGMVPLKPGMIAPGGDSFELERAVVDGAVRCDLLRRAPQALLEPEVLMVDADWYQPHFSDHLSRDVALSPFRRHSRDFTLHLVGSAKRHQSPSLEGEVDLFALALGLRMRPVLSLDEVRGLLGLMDCLAESHFWRIPRLLEGLEVVEELPLGRVGGLATFTYRFHIAEGIDGAQGALTGYFLAALRALLDAWVVNATIRVEAVSPGHRAEQVQGGRRR